MSGNGSYSYDVAIVGGGIIGLATALALQRQRPSLRLVVLEKENEVGQHQTGHNSGVIHAGIYYKPGSLKARLCVEGARRLMDFCRQNGIHYDLCGKVIIAVDESELPALEELHRRGVANGIPGLRKIGADELKEIEPEAAGVAALHSPNTGIVDFRRVVRAMDENLRDRGGHVLTGAKVVAVHQNGGGLRVVTDTGEVESALLINCAGLYSDEVARISGVRPEVRIIPFRGEYYLLRPERGSLIRGLIYPVPDPRLPFLGVHLTRTVHGQVEAGPNAVLALAREGYTKSRVNLGELWGTLSYRGFWNMARRYWKAGIYEYHRSFFKGAFARSLQRLVPTITTADLAPGGAGVRAQAVSPAGELVDDFRIMQTESAIHLLNAPSPAATASLAIGEYVAGLAEKTGRL